MVRMPSVRTSSPDTGRLVAHRQPIAPTIQASATLTAAWTPKITNVPAKSVAGRTTAVARVAATRAITALSAGRSGGRRAGPGAGWLGTGSVSSLAVKVRFARG